MVLSDIEINRKILWFIKYVRSYDNRNNKITINKIKLTDSIVQTEQINSSYKTFDTLYLRNLMKLDWYQFEITLILDLNCYSQ